MGQKGRRRRKQSAATTEAIGLIPYECEADRNPIIDGKLTIAPR